VLLSQLLVASEVKALANQTAKATEDIGAQIARVQEVTRSAVAAIQTISGTIGEMNGIAATIASAIEQQGAATQEIARNVQHAAEGTQQVTASIGEVEQAATAAGAAADQVLDAAGGLAQEAEDLNREVAAFLVSVKAA
jgi:methyl-accepting chemotaxis protein